MSTNLVPANVQVPAHLTNRVGQPSALATSIMGGITGGAEYPRISIKGSRFRIIDDGVETVLDTTSLDIVIVGANPRLSKTFYASAWNPDAEASAPDCQSMGGVAPDADCAQPQNDLCATCDQNAWGSKKTPDGRDIKACADQKRLAIVAADDPEAAIYLLQVTPAALKGLNAYQKELAMRGIAPEIVKTRITFDTDASFPKLMFGFGGFVDEENQPVIDTLFDDPRVPDITGEAKEGVAPTATARPVIEAEAAPTPEPEPEPEVVAEPSAAAKGFGAGKTTTKTKPAAKKAAAKKAASKKAAATEEPAAAPVADPAADDLANEIASLIGEEADDA